MAIVSSHRAVLALIIFWIAVPAALAGQSSKARKHPKPAIVSTAQLPTAPEPGASFLSSVPRAYWKQVDKAPVAPLRQNQAGLAW